MRPRTADMPAPRAGPTPRRDKQQRNKKLAGMTREFGDMAEGTSASKEPIAVEVPQKSKKPSAEGNSEPAAPQQEEHSPQKLETAERSTEKEAGPPPEEPQRGQPAEAEKPPKAAGPFPPEAGGTAEVVRPPIEAAKSGELDSAEIQCLKTTYERCSALSITEALVARARQEPPGVRLALLAVWRTVLAGLGADVKSFEPLWVEAGLDPSAAVTSDDRARAEAVAEEALAGCRLCIVDLPTFLKLVRRITLAERPDGDAMLVVDVGYNGDEVSVATRLTAWIKEKKDETQYVIPLILRERLRQLGLALDVDVHDLYVELVHRAERYQVTADAYIKPILLHAVEALRASPHLAKCTKDNRVIYIASELFRTSNWYFNSRVGLGRNKLYHAFRQHGLLARAETVVVELVDEYGEKVRRRALAFQIDRLSAFIEFDVSQLCKAVGLMVEEEKAWDAEPQGAAPGVEA